MGIDPPAGEPIQTSLKKVMAKLVETVPCITEMFNFQNIDNVNRNAILVATKKIMATQKETIVTLSDQGEIEITDNNNHQSETENTGGWDTVKNGNRMQTRSSQKEVDTNTNISNSYTNLQDDEDEQISEESTIVEELYNQFEDEKPVDKITPVEVQLKKNKKNKQNKEWDQTTEIMTTLEYDTIENVIKQGKTNTLDLDILCKWIMHKNLDILQACGALDNKVERCNDRIKTSAKQDLNAMDSAAKTAMKSFTDHVNKENIQSANKIGKLIIDVEQTEKRTSKNLKEHQKSCDRLKSEVKKAENESILTINKHANQKINDMQGTLKKAQALIDTLNGTKTITNERKKEINNLMTTLSNRLEGLSDKFDENITAISDKEQMRVLQWMEKRMKFMKDNTNDDVIQKLIGIQQKLEQSLEEVQKERTLVNEERQLLEGDRNAFYQWWQNIKQDIDHNKPNDKQFTFDTAPLQVDTTHNHQRNNDPVHNFHDTNIQTKEDDQDINYSYTFKLVDKHDEQPARSPINGRVDQEAPQPNQQIIKVEYFTKDEFPSDVQNPIPHGTLITYDQNIFKCKARINYHDNLPTYITDKWYYDIKTLNGVKLTNCSSKYITTDKEHVPSNVYGSTTNAVHNPYTSRKSQPVQNPYRKQPSDRAQQQEHNPYRQQSPTRNSSHHQQNAPWQQRKPLGPNEFIFPLGSVPISVRHHELIKYGNKLNLTINSKDEFRQFYEDFRNQLKTYNIFIVEYDKVELDQSLAEITPDNCENYNVAIKEMSRAIFQFFSYNKDSVFATYTLPIHSLDTYRPSGNGLKFLMNIMKRIHPRLKRNVVELDTGIAPMPCFAEYTTIHKFINALVVYRQDEMQNGRRYTDKEILTHIGSTLDERFDTAINLIKKELKIAYANPSYPLSLPEYLNIDSELAIRIIDMLDSDEKIQDLTNTNPISRNGATINRMDNQRNNRRDKQQQDKPFSFPKTSYTPNNRYPNNRRRDEQWSDKLKWEILPGAECPGCKRSNHNVYKTGCPAFAQFAICQDFYNKCPPKELEKVKASFTSYQQERRKQMQESKRRGRATIKKIEQRGNYDPEDMAMLKKTFFDTYKDDFAEEQYCTENPFDNFDEDNEDHEDQVEEIEV
jgi:hypothetical protein